MVLPLIARGIVRGIGASIDAIGRAGRSSGGSINVSMSVEGVAELTRQFNKLGNLKQASITKAAKRGANVSLKWSRKIATKKTGAMKKSMMLKGEKKARGKKKKVYRIIFNPSYTDIFKKDIKNPGEFGGEYPKSYYPFSQNFGWKTKYGFHKGQHFIEKGLGEHQPEIQEKIVTVLVKEIDKATQ